MILERFITPGMGVNLYLVGAGKQVIMIDPGTIIPKVDELIEERGYELQAIVLTHGHADHIGGAEYYRDKYHVDVYIHQADDEMLQNPKHNLSKGVYGYDISIEGAIVYQDKDRLDLGDIRVEIIHTPGHTKGSSCLLINDQLFSGDTLFKMGVGRWDLYGGDGQALMNSIKSKIFTLKDMPVYPGHGVATSIAYEKERNPFVG
ncbi:MAG TPA: MBL fold metallo-hydrolase [Tissierellia bacterium]|nr:MBL fold metallo-hydrolase [Tissierellia bacterium]